MTKVFEAMSWSLSLAEVNEILDGVERSWEIPDQKLPSDDFERDCYDAAIEKLFSEIEGLNNFDIIVHPSIVDIELEYQLDLWDNYGRRIGVAEIVIGKEAILPVDIKVSFY